jgi:hypothetical protein
VELADITDCPFEEKDPKKEGAIWHGKLIPPSELVFSTRHFFL